MIVDFDGVSYALEVDEYGQWTIRTPDGDALRGIVWPDGACEGFGTLTAPDVVDLVKAAGLPVEHPFPAPEPNGPGGDA